MKRPAPQEQQSNDLSPKRPRNGDRPSRTTFRPDLFDISTKNTFREAYSASTPYPHAVVPSLIEDSLLRSVRTEALTQVAFTLKETDIYRIYQSGDLANLSKLDAESLAHLPSLVTLRDALYSPDFREWISTVTGAGKVSGQKTDMAINIYAPGGHLLCHDDVIGTRRISFILYLTDPDDPWQPEWGGGLRLYSTETQTDKAGKTVKVPSPEHDLNIPPAFGQMSFFAVRPGESYHDVEEVYHAAKPNEDHRRVRIAISGWYHVPQEGEDGFVEGEESQLQHKSSLAQLQGASDIFDEPLQHFEHFDELRTVPRSDGKAMEVDPGEDTDSEEDILSEQDLTLLLKYLTPSFLTPSMTDEFAASFEQNSFLELDQLLNDKFASELQAWIESHNEDSEDQGNWRIACPPHKQRYLYTVVNKQHHSTSPIWSLLTDLLRSHAFKKWLALITGFHPHSLVAQHVMGRRFRRGKDYALASAYHKEQPSLEFTLGMSPPIADLGANPTLGRKVNGLSKPAQIDENLTKFLEADASHGGDEVYMAGDDDDTESVHSRSLPHVGKKVDPAIYRSADNDEDSGILFATNPSWNTFSVVLRDSGTLRFVKYMSQAAPSDRWDIKGEIELSQDAFDGEEAAEGIENESDADPSDISDDGADQISEGDEDNDENDENTYHD